MLTSGIVRHYKGKLYLAYDIATLVRTGGCKRETRFVVYQALYGEFLVFIRTLADFTAKVRHRGKKIRRFELICGHNEYLSRRDVLAIVKELKPFLRRQKISDIGLICRTLLGKDNVTPIAIVGILNLAQAARST